MVKIQTMALGTKVLFSFKGLKADGTCEFAPLSGTDDEGQKYDLLRGIPTDKPVEAYTWSLYRNLQINVLDFSSSDGAVKAVWALFAVIDGVPSLGVALAKVEGDDNGTMTVVVGRTGLADL